MAHGTVDIRPLTTDTWPDLAALFEEGGDPQVVLVPVANWQHRWIEGLMQATDRVIEAVCRLPIDFRSRDDLSPVELVRRSGTRRIARRSRLTRYQDVSRTTRIGSRRGSVGPRTRGLHGAGGSPAGPRLGTKSAISMRPSIDRRHPSSSTIGRRRAPNS